MSVRIDDEAFIKRTLKELEVGFRQMLKERCYAHTFNFGTANGTAYSLLIAILPTKIADELAAKTRSNDAGGLQYREGM